MKITIQSKIQIDENGLIYLSNIVNYPCYINFNSFDFVYIYNLPHSYEVFIACVIKQNSFQRHL